MSLLPMPDSDALRRLKAEREARGAKRPAAPSGAAAPRETAPTASRVAKRATAGRSRGAPAPTNPADPAASTLRVAGIDPGTSTGLACVECPMDRGRPDMSRARWVGHAVVHPSRAALYSPAEQRAMLGERVAAFLAEWAPAIVVLEEPADATGAWASYGRRVGEGRSAYTSFGLGAHFGLALGAAARDLRRRVYSYPVNNHRGRPGWMQGGASRPQAREGVLAGLRLFAGAIGAPDDLTEDVLMALGVLRFHITHQWEADRAAA